MNAPGDTELIPETEGTESNHAAYRRLFLKISPRSVQGDVRLLKAFSNDPRVSRVTVSVPSPLVRFSAVACLFVPYLAPLERGQLFRSSSICPRCKLTVCSTQW